MGDQAGGGGLAVGAGDGDDRAVARRVGEHQRRVVRIPLGQQTAQPVRFGPKVDRLAGGDGGDRLPHPEGEPAVVPGPGEGVVAGLLQRRPVDVGLRRPGPLAEGDQSVGEEPAEGGGTRRRRVVGEAERLQPGRQGGERGGRQILRPDGQLELDRRGEQEEVGSVQVPQLDASHGAP
jgi:hypothetical protein